MCLLTNKRYKTYQTGFSFSCLCHAQGVVHGGTIGGWVVKICFFQNSTRFGVWVTYINGTCNGTIVLVPTPGALGRGQKVKYHIISITMSISKIFKPNFVCLLTIERYKTYQMGLSFRRLGHAPGWDLGVLWGLVGSKITKSISKIFLN